MQRDYNNQKQTKYKITLNDQPLEIASRVCIEYMLDNYNNTYNEQLIGVYDHEGKLVRPTNISEILTKGNFRDIECKKIKKFPFED